MDKKQISKEEKSLKKKIEFKKDILDMFPKTTPEQLEKLFIEHYDSEAEEAESTDEEEEAEIQEQLAKQKECIMGLMKKTKNENYISEKQLDFMIKKH
jgi:hypothetical protein